MTREEWKVHKALDNITELKEYVSATSCQIKDECELSDTEIHDILDSLDTLKLAFYARLYKLKAP